MIQIKEIHTVLYLPHEGQYFPMLYECWERKQIFNVLITILVKKKKFLKNATTSYKPSGARILVSSSWGLLKRATKDKKSLNQMIENQKLTCAENRQYHLLWDPIAGELWDKFGKRNWNELNNKKTWLTLTIFCCSLQFIPTPPQALGEDIDVPFISCVPLSVQLGTAAIAPPGALIFTPNEPSVLWYKKWGSELCA